MESTTTNGNASRSHSHSRSRDFSTSFNITDNTEVQKIFDRFDTNRDGKISGDELAGVLMALGSKTTTEEVTKMMEEMDSDGDGYVSLDEFAEFCSRKVEGDENGYEELKDAFDMYDQDKNGLISAHELHLILSRLGEKFSVSDCERMILSVDSDGDGMVCFDEFRKMMTTNSGKSAS